MSVTVYVNESAIQAKLDSLLDDITQSKIQGAFASTINPYVPYDTGRLAHDIRVDADGVHYRAPYAEKNYYGDDIKHHKDKHPLATSHWDTVAMVSEKDNYAKRVEEILKQRAREKYG